MVKVDKSKPLPEIFETLMNASKEDRLLPAPAPKSPEQDKQDCSLPATMADNIPEFLREKHGTNKEVGKSDVPFDPPFKKTKTSTPQEPESDLTTKSQNGKGGTTEGSVGFLPEDKYKHKLAEAVLPLRSLIPFIAMFPEHKAHRVSQIVNSDGVFDPDGPESSFRHVVIYDSDAAMQHYEK